MFDPSQPGTDERLWRATLDAAPSWQPASGRLLIVSPHPDDEVLGAGGLIRQWTDAARPVTVLSVTDGEAAYPDWCGLDRVRRSELRQALSTLCAAPLISVGLSIPDGRVAAQTEVLRAALAALCDADTTLIAPYEDDGHPDHETAGRVCREFARSQGVAIARYPIWAWHHSTPARMPVQWGRFALPAQARKAKLAAARCFGSQLQPARRAPIIPPHVLEYFARPYEAFVL